MAAKLLLSRSHLFTHIKCVDHFTIFRVCQATTVMQQHSRLARNSRQVVRSAKNITDITDSKSFDHREMPKSNPLRRDSKIDYEYFKQIAAAAASSVEEKLHDVVALNIDYSHSTLTSESTPGEEVSKRVKSDEFVSNEIDLSSFTPAPPVRSFNLAAYVNESELLSNLVLLGVDLSKIETNSSVADQLVKINFDKDVKPILFFLHAVGLTDKDIAKSITRCPTILFESVANMQVRINYLESKNFLKEAIVRVISSQPALLITPTKEVDSQLGYIQSDFSLKGEEVRQVVTKYPKIALWSKIKIKDVKLKLKDFLGFSDSELKQLLLVCPKLYTSDKHALAKRFHYLHNVIGYSHQELVQCAQSLRTRTTIIRQRHLFLKLLQRDNFDATRENFVSPKSLTTGRDVEFCEQIAKVSVKQFNDFLKTL